MQFGKARSTELHNAGLAPISQFLAMALALPHTFMRHRVVEVKLTQSRA
jgi:hypothetical protein